MTQLIVTLNDVSNGQQEVSLISKAISMLKGVANVSVIGHRTNKCNEIAEAAEGKDFCPDPELKSIMGIAAPLKDIEARDDERFTYIMSK